MFIQVLNIEFHGEELKICVKLNLCNFWHISKTLTMLTMLTTLTVDNVGTTPFCEMLARLKILQSDSDASAALFKHHTKR